MAAKRLKISATSSDSTNLQVEQLVAPIFLGFYVCLPRTQMIQMTHILEDLTKKMEGHPPPPQKKKGLGWILDWDRMNEAMEHLSRK